MANQEHLEILKQGVAAWNEWKIQADIQKIKPDLTKADLSGANLKEVNFRFTRLCSANLSGANLERALFFTSNLNGANFSHANLKGSQIVSSDLYWTNLSNANLSESAIFVSALVETLVDETDFSNSWFKQSIFSNVDLSTAKGLETTTHLGASTMGIDTIYKSKGNIALTFLQKCGVPNDFIKTALSLAGKPPEFYSCFISYSSKDSKFAEKLYAKLQSHGVNCWFAPYDLKIGDKFRQRIEESIREIDKLLVILSSNSISSSWVEEEVESALERERREQRPILLPIRIDNAVMDSEQAWASSLRRLRHIGDFTEHKTSKIFRGAMERLLRDIKKVDKPERT